MQKLCPCTEATRKHMHTVPSKCCNDSGSTGTRTRPTGYLVQDLSAFNVQKLDKQRQRIRKVGLSMPFVSILLHVCVQHDIDSYGHTDEIVIFLAWKVAYFGSILAVFLISSWSVNPIQSSAFTVDNCVALWYASVPMERHERISRSDAHKNNAISSSMESWQKWRRTTTNRWNQEDVLQTTIKITACELGRIQQEWTLYGKKTVPRDSFTVQNIWKTFSKVSLIRRLPSSRAHIFIVPIHE